ncbi:MAG: ABC transporter permease [Planctomycetaceae bacterium]|nr:ABC transporter permease [Planctomycetaceae bacterium]
MAVSSERGSTSQWIGRGLTALGPLLALALVVLLFAGLEYWLKKRSVFLTADNLRLIAVNSLVIGMCSLGMTLIIVSGGIDLSVGSGVALCATVLACGLKRNWDPSLCVALALLSGILLGAINGTLVSLLRVVPFIITLGTMTAYLGAGKMLAETVDKGQTVRPDVYPADHAKFSENQVPIWLQQFTSVRERALLPRRASIPEAVAPVVDWVRFPSGLWVAVLFAAAVAFLLRFTVFGRYVFALGSNEATARLCGINVPLVRIAVYSLAGLFVGIAGVYHFARLASGDPTSGAGMELKVIAAVVIGGGSLSGGRGTVMGTLAGAVLMEVINSGCTQLDVPDPLEDVILGVIIIAAVTVDQLRQRRFALG